MKPIGPTFAAELAAAGLLGLPIVWDSSGNITYGPGITAAQIAAVAAVYAAHNPAAVPPRDQYAMLIAAGLAISSASMPSLNGVYAIDAATQGNIQALVLGWTVRSAFPGGTATINYPDIGMTRHLMTHAQLVAVASAIEDYVAAADHALEEALAGRVAVWPTAAYGAIA